MTIAQRRPAFARHPVAAQLRRGPLLRDPGRCRRTRIPPATTRSSTRCCRRRRWIARSRREGPRRTDAGSERAPWCRRRVPDVLARASDPVSTSRRTPQSSPEADCTPTGTPSTTTPSSSRNRCGETSGRAAHWNESTLRATSSADPRLHGTLNGIDAGSWMPRPASIATWPSSSSSSHRSSRSPARTTSPEAGQRS